MIMRWVRLLLPGVRCSQINMALYVILRVGYEAPEMDYGKEK